MALYSDHRLGWSYEHGLTDRDDRLTWIGWAALIGGVAACWTWPLWLPVAVAGAEFAVMLALPGLFLIAVLGAIVQFALRRYRAQ